MLTVTNSAAETRALGEKLASRLKAGDVVVLEGELGAGKSELARGIARGLGVTETVTSPSFTILNVYESGPDENRSNWRRGGRLLLGRKPKGGNAGDGGDHLRA